MTCAFNELGYLYKAKDMCCAWFLKVVGAVLHLVIGDKDLGKVVGMKICKTADMIKMMLLSKVIKRVEMSKFRSEANALCLAAPQSRSMFIEYWKSQGLDSNTSLELEDSFGSSNESDSSVGSSSDRGSTQQLIGTSSLNSHEHQMLIEYNVGTREVHIENLIPPHPSRATRVLDHEHVKMLKDSFTDSSCQVVILEGMMTESLESPDSLSEEGCGKVEVLGGNHTREALQTLHRKGTINFSTVKCNLYRPLPRILALRIGYTHNIVLHEKVKPVTFMEKARLIRDCRPSVEMDKDKILKWKDFLVTVFGLKDRRRLLQSFGVHLTIANLQPALWAKLCDAEQKYSISEKTMRGFVRIEDSAKLSCLEALLSEGMVVFKENVRRLIDDGKTSVASKKIGKKRQAEEETTDICSDRHSEPITEILSEEQTNWKQKFEELKERYLSLEEENLKLKNKIDEIEKDARTHPEKNDKMEPESKRRRCTTSVFAKGEKIMAFWRDEVSGEETWQEATVLSTYTDGRCRVQWKSDGMISTPRLHEVQKLQ